MAVERMHGAKASKGADQHQQRAFGQVEVGDEHVHHPKLEPWGDEDVGVTLCQPAACPTLQRAQAGGAHGHHTTALCVGVRNRFHGGGGNVVPLAVHAVFRQVLGFDRLKGARPHMQRDAGGGHTSGGQAIEHALVKVQRSRGRSGGAWVFGKHGLVARFVFGSVRVTFVLCIGGVLVPFNVGWQRHVTMLLHQGVRLVAELEAKQGAVVIGPATQQGGLKATSHVQHGAHGRLFADFHVRHHLVVGQHALDQELKLAAGGLFAKQAGFDHLGVVEHQQVACTQQGFGEVKVEVAERVGLGHVLEGRTGPFQVKTAVILARLFLNANRADFSS